VGRMHLAEALSYRVLADDVRRAGVTFGVHCVFIKGSTTRHGHVVFPAPIF